MFLGPFFPTPLTDLFAVLTPNYRMGIQGELCSKLEMRLFNCIEAYGSEKAKTKCLDLFYDLFECHHQKIQYRRAYEIRDERKRKFKAGEIDELYSQKPPLESYFHI